MAPFIFMHSNVTCIQWVDKDTKDILFETYMDDEEFKAAFGRSSEFSIPERGIVLDHLPIQIYYDDFYGKDSVCKAVTEVSLKTV